jgi:hypothetical protein
MVGVAAVLVLLDRLDSRRQAQVVVSDLRSLVEEAPGIPFQAEPGAARASAARARLISNRERFTTLVDALSTLDPDPRVNHIELAGDRLYSGLGASLNLVAAGEPERAGRQVVGFGQGDGALVELRTLLTAQELYDRAQAGDARKLSPSPTTRSCAAPARKSSATGISSRTRTSRSRRSISSGTSPT